MKLNFFSSSFFGLSLLLLTGCSSEAPAPAKKAEAKKPPEPATGQSALFQTYQQARLWSPDAMVLKMENGNLPEAPPQPGKYGLWRVTYVSLTKKLKHDFVYAVSDSEGGIVQGVRAGSESPYTQTPQVRPFAIQEVKVDTPAALESASKEVEKDKDMKKVLAENKDLPVQYVLEWTSATPKPAWRAIYGLSISQSKFSIYIDASDGKFLKKTH